MMIPGAAVIAKGLAAVCVLLLAALAWQTIRVAGLRADLATEQRDRKSDRNLSIQAAVTAIQSARDEEQRRIDDQQELINEQVKTIAMVRADAAAAAGSAGRLRQYAAELAAGCGAGAAHPAAAGPGAPAGASGDLLADMLGRIDDAARDLAVFADDAGTAGATCERAYDALRRRE